MREEILVQLPKKLSLEQSVFLVGVDDLPGLNQVKTLINELNRTEKKDWIKSEFREKISIDLVPKNTAIILQMTGTRQGTSANMKKASSDLGILCPKGALTVGEVKEALNRFAELRKNGNGSVSPSVNGNHSINNNGGVKQAEYSRTGTLQTESAFQQEAEILKTIIPSESAHNSMEVDSALAELEKFSNSLDNAKVAVMIIGDQLKVVIAERTAFLEQVQSKDNEIAELKTSLISAHLIARENAGLEDENKKLKGEVARLQKAFDNLETLIKGARGK
jgi:hypothetical protein